MSSKKSCDKNKITISDELVDNLADLSMLYFDEKSKQKIKCDLISMIDFFKQVDEYDLNEKNYSLELDFLTKECRDDVCMDMLDPKTALSNAELKNESFFLVPKIIDK